jgi:hypothetical protein
MPNANRPSRRRRWLAAAGLVAAVAVPVQHAAAAPVTAGGFTSNVRPSTSQVVRGASVTLRVDVTAASARSALVDIEVYDTAGRKAFQRYWDGQSFRAGVRRTFTTTWTVPAAQASGTYRVDVGVFSLGWGALYHWNRGATSLTVTDGAPVTTTTTFPPTTTTTLPPTTTTTRPPTTTSTTTAPSPPPGGRFPTLPPNSALPDDATCAARVRPAPEVRAVNAGYNGQRGVAGRGPTGTTFARVTGNFTGTTDEIIQWAACKWGIDEDIVRAQTAVESYWVQSSGGDLTTSEAICPAGHGIGVDGHPGQCPESWGVQQVRYQYNTWAFNEAITSTAYNLDVAMAARRSCFEGKETWLNTVDRGRDYAAGDIWGCVGMWFSGRWYTTPAVNYIGVVQSYLNQRIWETAGFINFKP